MPSSATAAVPTRNAAPNAAKASLFIGNSPKAPGSAHAYANGAARSSTTRRSGRPNPSKTSESRTQDQPYVAARQDHGVLVQGHVVPVHRIGQVLADQGELDVGMGIERPH